MRVLHVIDKMDPQLGGVCQAVRMLVAGLVKQNVHNEVVSLDDAGSEFIHHENFPLHCLGEGKGPWKKNPALLDWLQKNLSGFGAVIVHGLWLYHSYAVRKAIQTRYLMKAPVPLLFIMPHGMLDPYFQKAAGRKLKALRNWLFWKLVESKTVNSADALLFTCGAEQQLARVPFSPYRPKKETVIGLGIEQPPSFTPEMRQAFLQKCPAIENQRYLLFLSRIHEKKGVDNLVKAFANWKQNNRANGPTASTQNVKLVIAGPGFETSYGKSIQQLVAGYENVKRDIVCTGMLSGYAKWGAFYGAEAFVLPSHQENFGIAVVESLSCGTPVLISNQVNIFTEIETAGAGLVGADTTEGVQSLLEKWSCLSGVEKNDYAKRALALYGETFTVESTAAKLFRALHREASHKDQSTKLVYVSLPA